ncbi:MAG TPA: TonB-dependent receptor, partial [Woeseiaceae bacterium]|nr:TonB-dependent receptor [Woeseiaceae bacterium]
GAPAIEEIVVTSERRELDSAFVPASLSALDASRIAAINAVHPHELLLRFPGVWLSRGSGQESLPAIRSPVLTGAGACGAILTLEDGIPTRPAGFCNVNQVFELNTEQAAAVEVLRGPGNVLYGSNALHGVINVLMPGPGAPGYAALEAGANDYFRVQAAGAPSPASYASLVYADDGGFRVNTGYRQAKAYATAGLKAGGGDLRVAFSASDLDQETGGYIEGEAAYEDPVLRLSNPNPDSFREAGSQRLYAIWTREDGDRRIDVRPYLRHSDMRFLQHFLPGQPLEENGQTSTGFLALVQQDDDGRRLMAGIDLDVSESWVEETQAGLAVGSPFLVATRPPGKHYDYTVTGVTAAAYAQGQWALAPSLELTAGLRAETTWYDYDNRMLDGNTRDDGVPCDFGGCLYTRPGDRSDRYSDVAPHLALDWAVRESLHAYARLARGFRPPQATELYRLQSGQDVADLDSETVDSAEIGVRARTGRWLIDGVVFAMRKEDSVLRDASGFNVSGGRSRHSGLEANVDGYLTPRLRLAAAATLARHTYDFDRVAALGETFVSGRDVDTAPRWFGSVDLYYTAFDWLELALQWTAIGEYYLDAENEHEYPGHSLVNVRATVVPAAAWEISFRLYNLADERYADRADYAFGDYRYFPGRARELFVELRWAPGG